MLLNLSILLFASRLAILTICDSSSCGEMLVTSCMCIFSLSLSKTQMTENVSSIDP